MRSFKANSVVLLNYNIQKREELNEMKDSGYCPLYISEKIL